MLTYGISKIGFYHVCWSEPCQDAIKQAYRKGVLALSLCDGAGSVSHAAEGAEQMAEAAAELMAASFRKLISMPQDEIVGLFADFIQEQLALLHSRFHGQDAEAFGSTLLVCGFENKTGRFLAVHLGDGAIFTGIPGKMRFTAQTHSCMPGKSFLTTSPREDLFREMKVEGGFAERILLTSDGGGGIFYIPGRNEILSGVEEVFSMLHGFPQDMIDGGLEDLACSCMLPVDDYSVNMASRGVPHGAEKAFRRFAEALDAGMGARRAARRAGWGRRNRRKKMQKAKELMIGFVPTDT